VNEKPSLSLVLWANSIEWGKLLIKECKLDGIRGLEGELITVTVVAKIATGVSKKSRC
jgi:hypothetical protein